MNKRESENRIGLLTDSTCDLPGDILNAFSIDFLPLKIIYKKDEFLDRINISPGEVYRKFDEEIPTTSMPGPGEIKEKLMDLKERGFTDVLVIHISAGLSSTYNITKMVSKEIDGLNVAVIDSRLLSMGLGRLVLYAKELIDEETFSFNQIVEKTKEKIDKIQLYFVVKTLKYLKKGGRIGKVQGTIGELLKIKPIISIDKDGEYFNVDKARNRTNSINRLYEIAKEKIMRGKCYVDVMHADAEKEARELLDRLKKIKNVKDTFFGEISPAMAVHAGPGLIGVCITLI